MLACFLFLSIISLWTTVLQAMLLTTLFTIILKTSVFDPMAVPYTVMPSPKTDSRSAQSIFPLSRHPYFSFYTNTLLLFVIFS